MRPKFRSYLVVTLPAAIVFAGLAWQHHRKSALRDEIARERARAAVRAQLELEHQTLADAQPSPEELEAVLAERTAVAQLRAELESIRQRARTSAQSADRTLEPDAPPAPRLAGQVLAHRLWRNAGQSSPQAAFESVLWAAANGNIDALVPLLALDPEARIRADMLFNRLPSSLRDAFGSSTRLVAHLTAKDIPLGSATILNHYSSPEETKVTAQIFDAEGNNKLALFSLRPDQEQWQLVVPGRIVQRYTDWLGAPARAPSTP